LDRVSSEKVGPTFWLTAVKLKPRLRGTYGVCRIQRWSHCNLSYRTPILKVSSGLVHSLPMHQLISALDLLGCLLAFDPSDRVDVPTALTHAYVGPYHDPLDEPVCAEVFEKWEEVESLQTIQELRAAITKEIAQFREEVRGISAFSDNDSVASEEEEVEEEEILESGEEHHIHSSHIPLGSSPSAGYFDTASPMSSGVGLPRPAESSSSPLSSRIPLSRVTSRDRSRSRDPRDSTPNTPATALSTLSEDSFSAGPPTGRTSRRSSALSNGRRPNSFLFSNPFGGMTPMTTNTSNIGSVPLGSGLPSAGAGGHGHANGEGWTRPRSRAPSSTGDFSTLRPLIRQLSTVGLDSLAKPSSGTGESAHPGTHGLTDEVPPMAVSPSDAPPSEVGFA